MRYFLLLVVIVWGLARAGGVHADVPPPLPPEKESVAVRIEVDEKAKGPMLVVPNGVFTLPRVRPFLPKSELPNDSTDGLADDDSPRPSRHHMLMAGLALAMSLACGGLWLARRGGQNPSVKLSILVAVTTALLVGTVVWADIGPPPIRPFKERPARKIENHPVAFEGKTGVEFVYGQEPIRLILDKESYEKLKKGELKEVK